MKLVKPWPEPFKINTNGKYGMRRHPKTGKMTMHRGIDIAGSFQVTSAGDGVVVHVGRDWEKLSRKEQIRQSGGNTVVIDHGAVHTAYFHGRGRSHLNVGDRVRAGDPIFVSGTTGLSTGVHLHFEVRKTRHSGTDVDPTPYLNGNAAVVALPVSGREDRATWSSWQQWLKDRGYYTGRIDGIPGSMTYVALQKWLRLPETGRLDLRTRRGVQERLGVVSDGVWGRVTWTTLQTKLNDGSLS